MRLIGSLGNENDARRLILFLQKKGIESHCDSAFDAGTGYMSYQIWILDEDRIEEAKNDLNQFAQEPTNAAFNSPAIEPMAPGEENVIGESKATLKRVSSPFTTFIIGLCSFIFILNLLEEYPMLREGLSEKTFLITPIQSALLFDLPPALERFEEIIQKEKITPTQKIETLSPEVQSELQALETIPFWKGGYEWVLLKIKGQDTTLAEGPLFQKILEGQVWRLISPVLLHGEILHILFNMIWVWVLCRPIEQRIGVFRLLILTLIVGIGSNIAQYLMSGPFFIGYSGVVLGLAGFTWGREKIAPWEGYPMASTTMLFLLLFIGGMFVLQSVSFFLEIFTHLDFSPNIANTAHIAGALIGLSLARVPFFAEVPK
jgi:GlpG protein